MGRGTSVAAVALLRSFGQYPPVAWVRPSGVRLAFAVVNLLVAALVALAVFVGLPVRWWVVDTSAILITLALIASAVALSVNAGFSSLAVRIGAWSLLGIGLALLAVLVLTAAYLRATGGALGTRGVLGFALAAALVLPYFVVYPALQLGWDRNQRERRERQ
jgi:hypothetical protein